MSYTSWGVIAGETPTSTKWNILGTNDADFDSRINQAINDSTVEFGIDGAIINFDLSTSKLWIVTISGNRTLTISNAGDGRPFAITIQEDGTGGRTISWFSGITWMTDDGLAPDLSSAANKYTTFFFIPTSPTSWLGFLAGNN